MFYKNLVKKRPDILEHYGYFFHFYYEELLNKIPPKMLIRFLCICCFMGLGNYLLESSCVPMSLKGLKKYLCLDEEEFQETIDFMIENKLIKIMKNNILKINSKYCAKVAPSHDKPHTRIFEKALIDLYIIYEDEHEELAQLYSLLPYVNKTYNICCYNPDEKDFEKVKPISLKEISNNLSIHDFKTFEKFILTLITTDSVAVTIRGETKENPLVLINSNVCFGGEIEALEEISKIHMEYLSIDFYKNLSKTL